MNGAEQRRALAAAQTAARQVGHLLRRNLRAAKVIQEAKPHDLKLELDVRSQKLIEQMLRHAFPTIAILGEEGAVGDPDAPQRWVVDPIDGTVNFAHGIPHACVSIALQERPAVAVPEAVGRPTAGESEGDYQTLLGVVYDPFTNEMWAALRGRPAYLNGRHIQVSRRASLSEAVVAMGFSKSKAILARMLPAFNRLVHRVRKIRIMGSAALSLAYVAGGRMDVYMESGIRLWDVAAGGLLVECAGGEFLCQPTAGAHRYEILASNGILGRKFLAVTKARRQDLCS